ncbi:amino acid adenylation domain-containing protein [Nonomuraea sp. NPDC049400]|uniref:amino acid adenylation domain-containing protein n=1 Tax=Nonomuraea sp. NPDC049400 TaxID=3364352 RepID=UPI00378FF6A4
MTLRLNCSALVDLPSADRILFQSFGAGPEAAPAFDRIHHAFEAHAKASPTATAVTHLGESMTYQELDRHADRLAASLAHRGVRPGDRVGLFMTRSIPMVVGILAILKVGAAYVPQDIRITPAVHLRHIVDTASVKVILTSSDPAPRIPAGDRHEIIAVDEVIAVDDVIAVDEVPRSGEWSSRVPGGSGEVAVVIFTSGTTGHPNGVNVTHANLCNILLNEPGSLGIGPGTRVAQILNIAFDMAVWEILGALSHGATLVIRGDDIEETVRDVDVVIATPGILGSLDASRCRNVKVVAVAGERCPRHLADTWSSFSAFYNACGPTEVTIVNTMQRYDPRRRVLTIGRPLPNTTVYILDQNGRPCPIGEIGEMWAGGACVTAGYLGNDVVTMQRYRPDPFRGGGHLMFRTRDLGRWTPDGELEHHGRTDDQVKVRGFRVELDAVTSALELTADCARATTVLREGELIGFVSPASVDVEAARKAVELSLPYYCVPSRVVAVDELPMTDRGKVDKNALPDLIDPLIDPLIDVVA